MKIYITEDKYITKTELNKVTKKALESNVTGKTYGGSPVSTINGVDYEWDYRKDEGYYKPTCEKEEADMIYVYSQMGNVIKVIAL
ncbi:MAG: hypothetical protein ACI4KA_00980 [Oscillospiraceae bacterium]